MTPAQTRRCINRNILECKALSSDCVRLDPTGVLIETYWNVKPENDLVFLKNSFCINRNILECKVGFTVRINSSLTVLIETYWNVKMFGKTLSEAVISINRNILECKDSCEYR